MQTLRTRLIISHLLPLLVVIPIIGITLIYLLETQVLLANISSELTSQAVLLAQMTMDEPGVWSQPEEAQLFVTRVSPLLGAQLMLLNPDGRLLAANISGTNAHVGQMIVIYDSSAVRNGEITVHTGYSNDLQAEVADAFVPVKLANQQVIGIVRLTYRLTGVIERFQRLRLLIIGILAAGLLVGVVVGSGLAITLQRPIRQVTDAVSGLSHGDRLPPLPEQGPQEIRTLVSAVNQLVARLESLEQSRKQLLANLVHELGRPLGALRSGIQALQGGADQDTALRQELLAGMDEETQRLRHLLDDLSHLHDQILGGLELNIQTVSLTDWLPRVLAPWRETAQQKHLHWETSIPDNLPSVEADTDRLGQAIGNLLSNAVKYTPYNGTISISADQDDHQVWMRVSDTGPGIPPEEQDQIFTPFYRGKQGRRFPQGMGLGLSIARDLVEAHQGRLEFESTPGFGTSFTIRLPCRQDKI